MKIEDIGVGGVVYDVARGLIGRVKAIHEAGQFVSLHNKKPVLKPVLELETGDTLVVDEEMLSRLALLDPAHEPFFRDANSAVQQVVKVLCGVAAKLGVSPKLTFLMVGRALQVQGGILLAPEPGENGESWG